jgi:bacterioferritin-associated ferredoxin
MQDLHQTPVETESSDPIVCHCLQVSESTLSDAIAVSGITTMKELCRETGAGGGCTACHRRLRELLQKTQQSVPVC